MECVGTWGKLGIHVAHIQKAKGPLYPHYIIWIHWIPQQCLVSLLLTEVLG
jgi:hypothetical protein